MPKRKSSAEEEDSQVAPRLSRSETGATLTLPLDDEGSVDWSKVRESTKEKFKGVLSSDPTALEMVADVLKDIDDGEEGEGETDTPKITEANVGAIIDQINLATSSVIALLLGKFKKHPILRTPQGQPAKLVISPEVLVQVSQLTPKQHEELDPRALAVSQKYIKKAPAIVMEHLDLWMLGLMFLKYQQENMMKMVATQVALDIKAVVQTRQVAPKPIPPDNDRPTNGQATSPPPQDEGGPSLDPGFVPPNLNDQPPRV